MTGESNREEGKVQSFLALLQSQPTEADCQRCIEQLADYVDVQLADGAYQTQFPFVVRHMDSCVACAEAYALVYEVELADRNGRLPQPSHIPQPDLSFLALTANLWTILQSALHITQTRITLQLDAILAALLAPQPSLALTRAVENGRFGQQLLLLTSAQTPETELPFSLAVYADKENPELCLVEITVEPSGLSWPDLGGSRVSVSYGEVVVTELTDDWGTAVFANIPHAELETLKLDINF